MAHHHAPTVFDLGVTEIVRDLTNQTTEGPQGRTDFYVHEKVRIAVRPLAFPAVKDLSTGVAKLFSPHLVTVTTTTGAPDSSDPVQTPVTYRWIEVQGRWVTRSGKITPSKSFTASATFRPDDEALPPWLASLAQAVAQ